MSSSQAGPSASGSGSGSGPCESSPEVIVDFYGVYLLYTMNPRYKGRTYIGFTVDPERRLKQHNAGCEAGGARRTTQRGPWAMILIVHGFPNQISALRFEWAWQHPKRSRRLRDRVPAKKSSERMFEYNFRLLGEMLNTGPWDRLPLTVRWLRPDVKFAEFPEARRPPMHMNIVSGPVKTIRPKGALDEGEIESDVFTQQQVATQGGEGDALSRELSTGSGSGGGGDALICSICIEDVQPRDRLRCLSDRKEAN